MEYRAFALKYRPQSFEEVVGQEHVVLALKKAITTGRFHHAYLFCGPRGVGKTSLARVLAKALNCSRGPTISPCQECLNCKEITKGTSLDVIEIDGASNRGIEDIKSLRENVKLAPSYSRYKIYIIDEVHQITPDGFNALLKTLEEPPSHVKFIFATTHPHKIPPTILSRCQKFQFHLLPLEKIVEKLKKIVEKENIESDEEILYAIAKASAGSIRDAESLLDQVVPLLLEKKISWDITSILGIIEEDLVNRMVKFIVEKNLKQALEFIDKLCCEGKDLGNFLDSLIEHLKDLILSRISPKAFQELVTISPQTKEFLSKQADLISAEEVLKIIDLLIEAKDWSRKLNSLRIPLELALIKFCYSSGRTYPDDFRLNNLNSNFNPKRALEKDEDDNLISQEIKDSFEEALLEEKKEFALEKDVEEELKSDTFSISGEDLKEKWPQVIEEIKKKKVTLASYLSEAKIFIEGNLLNIGFLKKHIFHKEVLEKETNRRLLEKILEKVLSYPLKVKFVMLEEKSNSKEEKEASSASFSKSSDSEFINQLLDTFEGEIDTFHE